MRPILTRFHDIKIHQIDTNSATDYNYNTQSLFRWFFIETNIHGSLYETDNPHMFLLRDSSNLYTIECSHIYTIILHHYILNLENDASRYYSYNHENDVSYSKEVLENYKEQIALLENQCKKFIQAYKNAQFESYDYIMKLRQFINMYAALRTSLLWNAESLYDSKNSNNFLLLGVEDLGLSSYFRVNTWLVDNQSHYMKSILSFPNKDNYDIRLTGSWMRAISLVLEYLLSEKRKRVLVIWTGYFESMNMLSSYFSQEDIIYYDPQNSSHNLWDFIEEYSPEIIFVDSVSLSFYPNYFEKEAFDMLIKELRRHQSRASIVIDVSTKYTYLQDYNIPEYFKNDVFFVASIWKYLYGWMDLWFSWYILSPPKCHEKLSLMFSNSGAWVSNIDALKIPLFPSHTHTQLAENICEKIEKISQIWEKLDITSPEISVIFPKIEKNNFYSNLINIWYTDSEKQVQIIHKHKEKIVWKIMHLAKKHNIDISYSTSYGFYNTRFSVFMCTSVKSIPIEHKSYIRVSVWYQSEITDVVKFLNIIMSVLKTFHS